MELQELKKIMKKEGDLKVFEYEGYQCCVLRGPLGALNGYVALDNNHILYGAHYDNDEVIVHGGLTFSKYPPIHMPFPKSFKDKWVLGFDCAHACDVVPKNLELGLCFSGSGIYRDMEYVENEIKRLVNQLIDIQGEN